MDEEKIHIDVQLSRDEYDAMLLMCGFACGAASQLQERGMLKSFVHLTNRLNEWNPNFKAYEIPK
jgi:hypothetical protein